MCACLQASKLPPAFDRAWEKIGGGPADLYFPEEFLGIWNVESTLTSIKLPLGPDYVPDPKVSCYSHRGLLKQLWSDAVGLHVRGRLQCMCLASKPEQLCKLMPGRCLLK